MKRAKLFVFLIAVLFTITLTTATNLNKVSTNFNLQTLELIAHANAENGTCTQNYTMSYFGDCDKCVPGNLCCEVSAQCCENQEPYCD